VTGPTSLTDTSLYDGSTIGAWKKRFEETSGDAADKAHETTHASALASPTHKAAVAGGTSPSSPGTGAGPPPVHPAALTAMANAGLVKDLETRGDGKPLSPGELDKIKGDMIRDRANAGGVKPESPDEPSGKTPGKTGQKPKE
jgi:NADH-quinone oxidoreductase subunit E